jgi:predicted MPP superfamily phosphohydrolase
MIAITGDLIDSRNTDIEIALHFAEKATEIAPCYYVNGNHESRIANYDDLRDGLKSLGVIVLENEKKEFEKDGEKITVIGLNDPDFLPNDLRENSDGIVEGFLEDLSENERDFSILLSHRPELFDLYVENKINLTLCGHAHGGQFRLPFLGGIVAPNQGLFPKYDSGNFKEKSTNMIVSRGIGNSIIPFRFNNRPEVVLIELDCKTLH